MLVFLDSLYKQFRILFSWLSLLWGRGTPGGRRWYCWIGWYVPIGWCISLLYILHRLAAICDSSFDWGFVSPSPGKGVVVGGCNDWVPWVARWWLPVGSPIPIVTIGLALTVFAVLRLVTDRQSDRRTDGLNGLAKGDTMH